MKLPSISSIERYTETVGQRNEIDGIMTIILIIQRIFGQQILDPKWTWRRFLIHQLMTLSLVIYVAFGTYEILKYTNDVKLIAEASYTIIILVMIPLRYLTFVANRIIFRELYAELKTTVFPAVKLDSVNKVKDILRKGTKVVYALLILILCPLMSYILRALLFYIQGNRVTLSKSTSILIPMTSPYYEIGTFLHAIFMFQAGFIMISADIWFILFLYFYIIFCDCGVKILNVHEKAFDEDDDLYANRLNDGLRTFYVAHVNQVHYLNTLNKMFKWIAILPMLSVTLCMCSLLLLMSKEIDWTFAPNVLPVFAEIFSYNWFGEQIKTKAIELNEALINFDWTRMKLKDKKCYYIIVCYMNKNFGIQTAVGYDLSLITMTSVLKASYQAFTVLQTLDN